LHACTTIYWITNKMLLRYLSSYADWEGYIDDRRSTYSFIVYFDSNPISWSERKQDIISSSSTKAGYKATTNTTV
jgi:hypothetical protein